MLNNVIIIGRLVQTPEIIETETGLKRTVIVVAVPRSYKNPDGKYEADFIRCILWNQTAEHACEYCLKGDAVGIIGKIQVRRYKENDTTRYITEVIAEKITFLSSFTHYKEVMETN